MISQSWVHGNAGSARQSMAKYFITPAHYPNARFTFIDYGGIDNCSQCDQFQEINEYRRDDDLLVAFCKSCEDKLEL
jgi:hypothetical protein